MLLCMALILLYFVVIVVALIIIAAVDDSDSCDCHCAWNVCQVALKRQLKHCNNKNIHTATNNKKKHRQQQYAASRMQNNFQAYYGHWWCCWDWWCLTERRWVCAKQVAGGCQLSVVVFDAVSALATGGRAVSAWHHTWFKITKKINKEIIKESLKILKSHKHLTIVVI